MAIYSTEHLRNIALAGHGDSGKTSFTEAMLFSAKMIPHLGDVERGNTVTDFEEEEKEHRTTLATSLAFLEWNGTKVNLLDTPGYASYISDAKNALAVSDAALIVVSAVEGIESQTERTFQFAREFDLPIGFVVNKLDHERADFEGVLSHLNERFGREVVPAQIPFFQDNRFVGAIDLMTNRLYAYQNSKSGKYNKQPPPAEMKDRCVDMREALIEMVAEMDDALLEQYFEKGELAEDDLLKGLRRGVHDRKIFPAFTVSSLQNIALHPLLDAIVELFPSPEKKEVIGVLPKEGESMRRPCSTEQPFLAYIFKTIVDPFAGKITAFRIHGGTLLSDSKVLNSTKNHSKKVGAIYALQGKNLVPAEKLNAGDIGAVSKIDSFETGDTLSDPSNPITLEPFRYPEPAISFAADPKTRADEEKILDGLQKLVAADPLLQARRDPQTKELIISGTGQTHVSITLEKLKRRYGVEVELKMPKVPYRETIRQNAKGHHRHKKQTGGRGQYGECHIELEPLPRGTGFEFIDKIFGGAIPNQFIPSVEKGIIGAKEEGFLAGYPVVDFRVTLSDGTYHTVDSSDIAFKLAGSKAFKDAMAQANPTLLEPIMQVEITTPDEFLGDVMGDLNARRGRVQGMETQRELQIIKALVPLAEMLTYSPSLKSITAGQGIYVMELSHYDEVPREIQEEIIESKKSEATN